MQVELEVRGKALRYADGGVTRIRGLVRETLDLTDLLIPICRTLLFHSSNDTVKLTGVLVKASAIPIQLVVPDGNPHQASKVHCRHRQLKDIPRVTISTPNTATIHVRAETTEADMAILEANAHTLGVIEGEEVKQELRKFFQNNLEGTLRGRGALRDEK